MNPLYLIIIGLGASALFVAAGKIMAWLDSHAREMMYVFLALLIALVVLNSFGIIADVLRAFLYPLVCVN